MHLTLQNILVTMIIPSHMIDLKRIIIYQPHTTSSEMVIISTMIVPSQEIMPTEVKILR